MQRKDKKDSHSTPTEQRVQLLKANLAVEPSKALKEADKHIDEFYRKHKGGIAITFRHSMTQSASNHEQYKIHITMALDDPAFAERFKDHESHAYKYLKKSDMLIRKCTRRGELGDLQHHFTADDLRHIISEIKSILLNFAFIERFAQRQPLKPEEIYIISSQGVAYPFSEFCNLKEPLPKGELLGRAPIERSTPRQYDPVLLKKAIERIDSEPSTPTETNITPHHKSHKRS